MTMNDYQYKQYLNIVKAFTSPEYRGYETKDPILQYEPFAKQLLASKYIIIKCRYPDTFRRPEYKGRLAIIIYTSEDSEFHKRTVVLKNLLNKIITIPDKNEGEYDLFMITHELLKKRPLKAFKEYAGFKFTNYTSVRFSEELPKAVGCNQHEIITEEEKNNLIKECYLTIDRQKYIAENDPQNIWIGGFSGELVKITKPSPTGGYAIDYRYIMGIIDRSSDEPEYDEEQEQEPDDE